MLQLREMRETEKIQKQIIMKEIQA